MSIAFDILKEELDRLKKLAAKYDREIKRLPQGSLSLKKRYNKEFAYLAFRVDNKVVFKYLGKPDSQKVANVLEKLKQKRQYRQKLKNIRHDIRDISKAIHARKASPVR
jgi:uncharacterized protein (UPF0216 family)